MKLIIDISEEEYKFIKMAQNIIIGGRGNCKTIQKDIINAIRNGIPYNPSEDLISRSDIKTHIGELLLVYSGAELANAILNAIDNAPTVSPEKALMDKLKGGAE